MALREYLILSATLNAVLCYSIQHLFSSGGVDAAFASFLPSHSGLFLQPFVPQRNRNESFQELSFVTFPESRGVLASLGPLQDFASLSVNNSVNSARFFVDFYEIKGYVVRDEVSPDFPFIQVLFLARTVSDEVSSRRGSQLCVELVATKGEDVVTSFCHVDDLTRACLSNITAPDRWWSLPSSTSSSSPARREDSVEMSFIAYSQSARCPRNSQESNLSSLLHSNGGGGGSVVRRFQAEGSLVRLKKVLLVGSNADTGYEINVKNSEIYIYTPRNAILPARRFKVLIKLRPNSLLKKFSIRAKTKSGLRILGIETHHPWQTDLEVSSRRQVAEVVAFNTNHEQSDQTLAVFDWQLEADPYDQGLDKTMLKVGFTMEYLDLLDQSESIGEADRKVTVKIRVVENTVEKLIAVLEDQEIVNVAPVTGQTQSYHVTLYAVSGVDVADVTGQSSCSSTDESVLQVSETCSRYFTSGRETRGSTSVKIRARYGGLEVAAKVRVWIVETPVQVELSDNKLSLMAGWKVPLFDPGSFSNKDHFHAQSSPKTPLSCQARFQSSVVNVYARFVAHEHDAPSPSRASNTTSTSSSFSSSSPSSSSASGSASNGNKQEKGKYQTPRHDGSVAGNQGNSGDGHVTYLLHRKASFKVTHLLRDSIRSADPGVVGVDVSRGDGVVVGDGVKPGKTEIQVVSHAGNVVGSRDIRVTMDKVILDHVKGHATSDLRLHVASSNDFPGAEVLSIRKASTMLRKYQESLLEVFVGFDDDTSLPLQLIHPDNYVLSVESLDNNVIEVVRSDYEFPKLVARGSGLGDLVSLALGPSRFCPTPRPRPLATGHVHVDVNIPQDDLLTQNDAGHFFGFPSKDIIELDVETVKKNNKFERNRQKISKFGSLDVPQNKSSARMKSDKEESSRDVRVEPLSSHPSLSSNSSDVLHITMYVLLGIFGLAIAIFVVNCFFYITNNNNRKSKMADIFVGKTATIKEVQDWIWIDKKTLERNAVNTKCTRALMSPDEFSRASKASSSYHSGSSGECRLSSATDFSSEVSCLSSSAGGGKGVGLYRGSECSVRIGVPVMPPDDNGNTLPQEHDSPRCGGKENCKHLQCKLPSQHASLTEQIQPDSDVEMAESFRCVSFEGAKETPDGPRRTLDGADPLLWKNEEMAMSYEQLMKYFNNLKESDA